MCRRCGLPIYRIPQDKYFNWAGGLRATDENHDVAQRFFERMKLLSGSEPGMGDRKLAEEGLYIAQKVREGICKLMDPNDTISARNIVFGNSTSLALLPVIAAYHRAGYRFITLFDKEAYTPLLRLLSFVSRNISSEKRLPIPGDISGRPVLEDITQQNYGQNGNTAVICRTISNNRLLSIWADYLDSQGELTCGSFLFDKSKRFMETNRILPLIKKSSDGKTLPLVLFDALDGEGNPANEARRFLFKRKFNQDYSFPYLVIADVSHIFGLVPIFPALGEADVIVASSSKVLAAEPTIGFAYVSDSVLDFLVKCQRELRLPFPRIAFQFHPDVVREALEPGSLLPHPDEIDYWVSLPELASFQHALDEFNEEGYNARLVRLFSLRNRFVKEALPALCNSQNRHFSFYPPMLSNSHPHLFIVLAKEGFSHDLFSDCKMEDYDEVRSQPRLWEYVDELYSSLEEAGIGIRSPRQQFGLLSKGDPYRLALFRFSWNPNVIPDFFALAQSISKFRGPIFHNLYHDLVIDEPDPGKAATGFLQKWKSGKL